MNFHINKVKTTYPINLEDVKKHLRIDSLNTDDDTYLEDLTIKSAMRFCENFIDKDIAVTSNTLTYYDFGGSQLRIDEGNLVSIDNIISDTSTLITSYTYEKYDGYFIIDFTDTTLDNDPLIVEFTTGYDVSINILSDDIKNAIFIKCSDLYYNERGSYNFGGLNKNNAIERLLTPYKAIRW